MPPLPVIEINLDAHGMGTITIDGHNIAHATCAVRVETRAGELPRVVMEMHAHAVKVNLPAEVIADVRNAIALDEEAVQRITDQVIRTLRAKGVGAGAIAENVMRRINQTTAQRS